MADHSVSSEDAALLDQLYTAYLNAVEQAREALRSQGMNSDLFRTKDGEAGSIRRQIRELLGAATKWDEWE